MPWSRLAPFALLLAALPASGQTRYAFEALPGPSGAASALGDAGVVVGRAYEGVQYSSAMVWRAGRAAVLRSPFGFGSAAHAIGPAGLIVGECYTDPAVALPQACAWHPGRLGVALRNLPGAKGLESSAAAINGSGVIAGLSQDARGDTRAVTWSRDGGIRDLGVWPGGSNSQALGLNDAGVVVGGADHAGGPFNFHAVEWVAGELRRLDDTGAWQSIAVAVNASGWVVGSADLRALSLRLPYSWRDGVAVPLPVSGADVEGEALAIDDAGDIVGYEAPLYTGTGARAVAWLGGGAEHNLNDLVDPSVGAAGWTLLTATSIDADGRIAGMALNPVLRTTRAYLLTPRP